MTAAPVTRELRRSLPPPAGAGDGRRAGAGRLVAAVIPVAAYLAFVLHFGVNAIYWDDWALMPMVHAALHGHLTFGQLWAPHNENRMLIPNLLFVLLAWAFHLDTVATMVLSAAIFIATYLAFLRAADRYAGRPLRAIEVFGLGAVWFGFEDYENALWNFQLAWFLVVALLFVMILAFSARNPGRRHYAVAAGAAVAASVCSLQGLILWPVGLICLAWRHRGRQLLASAGGWMGLAIITTAVYAWHFQGGVITGGHGSPGYFYHHPGATFAYMLAIVGNVLPLVGPHLTVHEAVGAALWLACLWVIVAEWRRRRPADQVPVPLPVCLIVFGLAFDGLAAIGRVSFGVSQALSSRYTLCNLIVLLGIATHLLGRRPARRHIAPRPRWSVAMVSVVAVLCVQAGLSDRVGIAAGGPLRTARIIDARAVVNLNQAPAAQQVAVIETYSYPSLPALLPLIADVRQDRLGTFAPGAYAKYRSEGFPTAAART